jgi:hypothetical protein
MLPHKRNDERERPTAPTADVDTGVDADVDEEIADGADGAAGAFTCTACGRTDLPEAGDWDPPICQECDAAINNDAIQEEFA